MNRLQCASTIAIAFLTLAAGTQCARPNVSAQQDAKGVGAAVRVVSGPASAPALQGRPEAEVLPFEYRGTDLRAEVLARPAPDVWLSFDAQGAPGTPAARVELPAEAKELFKEQWEVALAARYELDLGNTADVQTRVTLMNRIFNAGQKTARGLTRIEITAPDGMRPLTLGEANALSYLIGRHVVSVVEQAKEYRQPR